MDRAELERLDREGLVQRAQAAGVRRARLLTRPELVDELLRLDPAAPPSQLKKTRGFFGLARDLLTRVVERGLHLPDAADRLRAALGNPFPEVPRPEPQAVPTVTLAEIYAAQGHRQRAIDTLKRVLEDEPDHGAARVLLEKLQAEDYVAPPLPLPPEVEDGVRDEIGAHLGAGANGEISGADHQDEHDELDELEPETQRVDHLADRPISGLSGDECIAIPLRGGGSYVGWRLSAHSRQRLVDEPSFFFVRAVILVPSWDGPPVQEIRDVACDPNAGELVLTDLGSGTGRSKSSGAGAGSAGGTVVRVAVGILDHATFVPFSHSPAFELTASSDLVCWTLTGPTPIDATSAPIAHAIARAKELTRQLDRSS